MSGQGGDPARAAALGTAVGQLGALLTRLDLQSLSATPRQIAELLWLSALPSPPAMPPADALHRRMPARRDTPASAGRPDFGGDPETRAAPPEPELLFLPQASSDVDRPLGSAYRATNIRLSGPGMLSRRRDITRALRPLKRRVPARVHRVLDEDATASYNAQQRHWMPVFTPAQDRWLDVALIVDAQSECAVFWEPLAREIYGALQQLGAFRDVRLRYLHGGSGEAVGLSPHSVRAPHLLRSPAAALDPTRPTITLVLTDAVAPAWRTARLLGALHLWATRGPTAILQALPERTWEKTALVPVPARLLNLDTGSPNSRLSYREYGLLPGTQSRGDVPIPVLEISPKWLGPWARAIGAGGAFDGRAVILRSPHRTSHEAAERDVLDGDGHATQTRSVSVDEFRASVQPDVFRLAAYLAAAPLNLSVMRTVQSAMMPDSPLSDLAEVIFSGLLRRMPTSDHEDAISQDYAFIPGARERLLGALRSREADDVLTAVSAYIARHEPAIGSRFTAAVLDPHGKIALSAGARHWAEVHNLVRSRQGRPSTQLAIQPQPTPRPAGLQTAASVRAAVNPPPEVVSSGPEAVHAFLRDCAGGTVRLWRSKMLLVGQPSVGKTSLAKRLAGERYDPDEAQTHGVRIDTLELAHPIETNTTMQLAVWDFGGQPEYRVSQRFYLTDHALYLLVWNARARWQDGDLLAWLDMIAARAPSSRILIIATHCDGSAGVSLPDDLHGRFPLIVGIHEVDAKSGRGIDLLREVVCHQIAAMPSMGAAWPKSWIEAAARIQTLDSHATPATRVWPAMAAAGAKDPQSQRVLVRSLHDRREIVFFADDPELNDTLILRPAWLEAHVTAVLDSQAVAEARGVLTRAECGRLWGNVEPAVRDWLVRMMERQDLAYRVDATDRDEDVSLVIDRLGNTKPPAADRLWLQARDEPDAREVGFTFELNSRQPGIPGWFFARQHRYTTGLHWTHGALLHDHEPDYPTYALVLDDGKAKPAINIQARGRRPARLLSSLVDAFTNIVEQRYPGLITAKSVSCLCRQPPANLCGHSFSLDELVALAEASDSRSDREAQCPITRRRIDANAMLGALRGADIEVPDQIETIRRETARDSRSLKSTQQTLDTSVPSFYLSFPRTRWPDSTDDDVEADHWVTAFSRDLTAEVAAQAARTHSNLTDLADLEARLIAAPPQDRVSIALATCRVFVPLFSPEYFDSLSCGREWTIFNDRIQADYAVTHHIKDAVIPVLWRPLDADAVPPIARRYQVYSNALGEEYRRRGIRQMLLQRPLRAQYRVALSVLARQIVLQAERMSPAPGPQRVLDQVPNAFETSGWIPADRRELRITVAAPAAGDLPRGPSPDFYGDTAEHWRPYWPGQAAPVAQIAERIGRAMGFHPIVEPFERCAELRHGGRPTAPTILLVDPWAAQVPLLAERLLRFDRISAEKTWVRLAIPWKHDDTGMSNNYDVELHSGLLRVLEHTRRRCQIETPAAVAGLHTAADFGRELPSVINAAEKRFLQQVRAFPPDTPQRNAPSWRPRLRGPVSEAGPQDEGEEPHAERS